MATCYAESPVIGGQLSLFDVPGLQVKSGEAKSSYKVEITEVPDANVDGESTGGSTAMVACPVNGSSLFSRSRLPTIDFAEENYPCLKTYKMIH